MLFSVRSGAVIVFVTARVKGINKIFDVAVIKSARNDSDKIINELKVYVVDIQCDHHLSFFVFFIFFFFVLFLFLFVIIFVLFVIRRTIFRGVV